MHHELYKLRRYRFIPWIINEMSELIIMVNKNKRMSHSAAFHFRLWRRCCRTIHESVKRLWKIHKQIRRVPLYLLWWLFVCSCIVTRDVTARRYARTWLQKIGWALIFIEQIHKIMRVNNVPSRETSPASWNCNLILLWAANVITSPIEKIK